MIEVSTTSTNIAAASRICSLRSLRIGPAAPSGASTVVITYLVPVPARVPGSEATMVGPCRLGTTRKGSGLPDRPRRPAQVGPGGGPDASVDGPGGDRFGFLGGRGVGARVRGGCVGDVGRVGGC